MRKSTPTSPVKRETKPSAEALSHMRAGDVLVVRRLPRPRRSLKDLLGGTGWAKRMPGLRSLVKGLRTNTAHGRMAFQIFGAIAEFEHELTRAAHAGRPRCCAATGPHRRLSIPQRCDSEQLDAGANPARPRISIPRRCDSEPSTGGVGGRAGGFQYLKGAIQRHQASPCVIVSGAFQYLKGAIQRSLYYFRFCASGGFQYLKGAIQRRMLTLPSAAMSFISIPQRCDSEPADFDGTDWIDAEFQYLKGAIQSWPEKARRRSHRRISIPQRCDSEALPAPRGGAGVCISIPQRCDSEQCALPAQIRLRGISIPQRCDSEVSQARPT